MEKEITAPPTVPIALCDSSVPGVCEITLPRLLNILPKKPVAAKQINTLDDLEGVTSIVEKKERGIRVLCAYRGKNEKTEFYNKHLKKLNGSVFRSLDFRCSMDGCLFDGTLDSTGTFHVFDGQYIGFEKITSKSLWERKKILNRVITDSFNVKLVPHEKVCGENQIMGFYVKNKCDGIIIKNINDTYMDNRPLWNSFTTKKLVSEAVVTESIKDANGKYRRVICYLEDRNQTVQCRVPLLLRKQLNVCLNKKPVKAFLSHDRDFTRFILRRLVWK